MLIWPLGEYSFALDKLKSLELEQVKEWCQENSIPFVIKSLTAHMQNNPEKTFPLPVDFACGIEFENKIDAVAFKLRWL